MTAGHSWVRCGHHGTARTGTLPVPCRRSTMGTGGGVVVKARVPRGTEHLTLGMVTGDPIKS